MIFIKSAILLWISKKIPKVPSIAPKNGARRVPREPPEHFWGPRGVRYPWHFGASAPKGCQSEVWASKKSPEASKRDLPGCTWTYFRPRPRQHRTQNAWGRPASTLGLPVVEPCGQHNQGPQPRPGGMREAIE